MRPATYRSYTDDELNYIKEHCNDNFRDVAATINAPPRTVSNYMRRFRRGDTIRHQYPIKYYYALYIRKTDELVCCGTAKECAETLGVSVHTFYGLVHKTLNGIVKKYDVYIEPYEEETE